MCIYIYITRYLHKVTYGTALWALWCPRNGALVGPGRCSWIQVQTMPKSPKSCDEYVASSMETDQEIDVFIQRIHGYPICYPQNLLSKGPNLPGSAMCNHFLIQLSWKLLGLKVPLMFFARFLQPLGVRTSF